MDARKINKFFSCGGCTAKLPQGMLRDAVSKIPRFDDQNLLVGFDTSDDGAVYKINCTTAIIQTLDFFPPITDDPYIFGQIAAANALSDIYAMGGKFLSALNIVCFPEDGDAAILAEILRGGADKVAEAGGVLCGGHSIADNEIKYGLSATGVVHPDKILYNNRCRVGDKIILTKPLGVGIIAANRALGGVSDESFADAVKSMRTLNKYAFEKAEKYDLSACTDVTGFGFLGHLNEMVTRDYSIAVNGGGVLFIPEALLLAEEFLITGGGQANRDYLSGKVRFDGVSEPMQDILFDPQTSGGLLICVSAADAEGLLSELNELEIKSSVVAEVVERTDVNVVVN